MCKVIGVARGEIGALQGGDAFAGEKHARKVRLAPGAGGLDGSEVGAGRGQEFFGQGAGVPVAGGNGGGGKRDLVVRGDDKRLAFKGEPASDGLFFRDCRSGAVANRQRHAEAQSNLRLLLALAPGIAILLALEKDAAAPGFSARGAGQRDLGFARRERGVGKGEVGAIG